jgi:signal transduction histidine kinase
MSATAASAPSAPSDYERQLRTRQTAEQLSRIALITGAVLTTIVLTVVAVRSVLWLNQTTYLPFFIEYPTDVDYGGLRVLTTATDTMSAIPLEEGERITAVAGTPVSTANDIYAALGGLSPGDSVSVEVMTEGGAARTAEVTLVERPANAVSSFVVLFGAALVHLGLGLWVSRSRRQYAVGRIFLIYAMAGAVFFATLFDLWTVHMFTLLWGPSMVVMGTALLSLSLIFPSELPFIRQRPGLRFIPPVLAMAVIGVGTAALLSPEALLPGRMWMVEYIYGGLCIAILLLLTVWRALFARSPTNREQARFIMAGAALAFTPFFVFLANVEAPIEGLIVAALLLFPATVAYAITQYRTLDSTRLLSFTGTYSVMLVVLAGAFALLTAGLNFIFIDLLGVVNESLATNPLIIAALTFAVVLGFQPVRQRLQRMVDAQFFRTVADYDQRLTVFRQELTVAAGLSDVVRLLKSQVRETLMPTHVYIFLRDAQSGDFVAHGEGARPDTDVRFTLESGLVHALSTTRDVLFLEYDKPLPPELVEEHASLAVMRTPILAPLQGQERLAGWVAVGHKRSNERYTVQDIRFIQALGEQASLAVERAQVIGDLQRRVRELDVLSQVSQAVNFTTDPDVLLELIFAQSSKLIDTTNFYIVLHRPEVQAVYYGFFLENDERYEDREGQLWSDRVGLEAEVIRTGGPIRTDDYLAECAQRGVQPKPESKHYAWMGVPLNAGNRTLGAMVVASFTPGVVFTEDHMKVFWSIADQAATALDKARLFRETELRALQLQTLNEISNELSSELDLETLLGGIMRSAVDILNSEAGSLFLIDEATGDLVFRVVEGGAQNLVGERIEQGTGIVGQVADTRLPEIVNSVTENQAWRSDVDDRTEFSTESIIAVPLLIHDEAIGVLEVINKRDGSPFTQDDVALLTTFGAQAAVAIENARLYEATDQALAERVDELQNLQRIDRELNRTLNFDRVLNITLDWALRTTGASAGMIAMLSPDETQLDIAAATGYADAFHEEYGDGLPLGMGIAGRVMQTGKPEFVTNINQDDAYENVTGKPSAAQITVPILRANQPIGILVIESEIADLFTPNDFDFIQRLVEHAAVAIENARLVQGIEQASRDKTEFISFIAHELKNPMTSIRGYTDLLRSGSMGEVNDMQDQFLGTVRNNVDRMTRLVSDLSDMAKLEERRMALEKSPIDPKAPVEETVRSLSGQIEEKEQELVLDMPDDLPQVMADNTRIIQVLTNLLSNAHKYTPEGGRITIKLEHRTITHSETGEEINAVAYNVTDTGIGLSEEDIEKLFQKFFRADRGKEMAKGTGLGLVITRDLVLLHDGEIWVESEVGEGTTFTFYLPTADYAETEEAAE